MTREIPLTHGHVALVDDEDYDDLVRYRWHARKEGRLWYAFRTESDHKIAMHNVISGHLKTGHVNGNCLDNRRSNLVPATQAQGRWSERKHPAKKTTSRFKGVSWDSRRCKWVAQIKRPGSHFLGRFVSEEDAARAYDEAAREAFGEFAALNFPGPGERSALGDFNPEAVSAKAAGGLRKIDGTSAKYIGVCWHKASNKWQAAIKVKDKRIHIGVFSTPEEAAHAYDKKARELLGSAAKLNFPKPGERSALD